MGDTLKVTCKAWTTGASTSGLAQVRLIAAGQTGPAVSGISHNSEPDNYNITLECPAARAGSVVSGVFQGDINGGGGTIHIEVAGCVARYEAPDPTYVLIEPDSIASNRAATYLLPSGLRQNDEALKSIPFDCFVSGTTTSDGSWDAMDNYNAHTWVFAVPAFVSGVA